MTQDFTDKLRAIAAYTDRFQQITLFELTQYFGEYLFLVVIWLSSIPFFFFSAQIVVLPLATLCLMCAIWYFFDVSLWLPDAWKAKTIPAATVKKAAVTLLKLIDKWDSAVHVQTENHFASFWVVLGPLSVVCMGFSAFAVGFAQSHSFLPVLSLFVLPIALLIMDFYLACIGCLFLLLQAAYWLW